MTSIEVTAGKNLGQIKERVTKQMKSRLKLLRALCSILKVKIPIRLFGIAQLLLDSSKESKVFLYEKRFEDGVITKFGAEEDTETSDNLESEYISN